MSKLKVYLVMAVDEPCMPPAVEEIFASKELAESHLAHLHTQSPYSTYFIQDWDVLDAPLVDQRASVSEGTFSSSEGES